MLKYSLPGCLAAALLLVSCQDQSTDPATPSTDSPTRSELFAAHELDHIRGSHNAVGHQVSYVVDAVEDRYTLTLTLDDQKTLTAVADYDQFHTELNGHQHELTATEALALNTTAIKLAEALYTGTNEEALRTTLAENTLIRLMDWFSYIPPGYRLGKEVVADSELQKSRNNDGVTCVKKNRYYTISWDDSRGNRSARDKAGRNRGGNYNCMARCGAGCGRWWIPSSWTLDCFEHDECSRQNNSSGGASDSNCGDEWIHASDDWTFGVIRGCSG